MLTPLLFIVPSLAYWRMPCVSPVQVDRIDPLVNPGTASGHMHTIMGASNIGLTVDFASLQESQCTSCMVAQDKSLYWTPTLYYQEADGTFHSVTQIGGATVYYLQRGNDPMVAFPEGFRMLAGNPIARNYTGTLAAQAISHKCIDYNIDHPQTPNFPSIDCPDGLRTQVVFPSCWDGVNLDSPDHQSHMAYPDQVDNGNCPSSHPKRFITLFMEVLWNITEYRDQWPNNQWPFVLSCGDPTGYGHHADFISGWQPDFLQTAINNCTNDSGTVQDCYQFELIPQTETTMCRNEPLIKEAQFGHLDTLPGCNPIQSGPAPATRQPTCVAATLIQPSPPPATTTFSSLPTPSITIPSFVQVWTGIDATIVADGWVGYNYILKYDPYICSDLCLQVDSCVYFVLYDEQQSDGTQWPTCQYYNAVWGSDKAQNNGWGGKPITKGQAWGLSKWVPGAPNNQVTSIITMPIDGAKAPASSAHTSSKAAQPPTKKSSTVKATTSVRVITSAKPSSIMMTLPKPISSVPSPKTSVHSVPSATSTPAVPAPPVSSPTAPVPSSSPQLVSSYGNWTSLGCFTDSATRLLTNYFGIADLTVPKCLDACASRGFAYGGLEDGGQCFCDTKFSSKAATPSSCNMPCLGDSRQLCGGAWGLNVYHTSYLAVPPPSVLNSYSTWSSVGCFTEGNGGNALEALLVQGPITANSCLDTCASKGYKYAGLEDGALCYCGNEIRFDAAPAATGCSIVCSGNNQQICGGPNRLSMYLNSAFSQLNFVAINRPLDEQSLNVTAPHALDLRSEGSAFLATHSQTGSLPTPTHSLTTFIQASTTLSSVIHSMQTNHANSTSMNHTPFIRGRSLPTLIST